MKQLLNNSVYRTIHDHVNPKATNVNSRTCTYWRESLSEPGKGSCGCLSPGCSRAYPSQTDGETEGPGPDH